MLCRRLIGLVAIYALVLQTLFTAVAVSTAAGGGAVVCTGAPTDENGAALAGHDSCLTCGICGASAAPERTGLSIAYAREDAAPVQAATAASPRRETRPQLARAPPAA